MKRLARTTWSLNPLVEQRLPTGAEWHEAVIRAGVQGFGGPPHGHETRWDWGATATSLGIALDRAARLERTYREMTPKQRAQLWGDTSPVAAEMRRVASRC